MIPSLIIMRIQLLKIMINLCCNSINETDLNQYSSSNQQQKLIITLLSMPKPIFQEFKNALHMSKLNQHVPDNLLHQFKQQRSIKTSQKQGQISQFGFSTFSRHFKDIEHKQSKFKECIEGIGITIDDSGHLIIAQWKNNQIDGKYFIFQPNLFEENCPNNQNSALCQYGSMKNGQLDGDNYIYNGYGTLAKAEFHSNKAVGKCYIVHSNKLFITNQTNEMNMIQCEVVNLNVKNGQVTKYNLLNIPENNSISKSKLQNKSSGNFEQISAKIFFKPNLFIQSIIRQNQQQDKNQEMLVYAHFSERECFIGFLEADQKKQKMRVLNKIKKEQINGFGVVFKNQWPISFGTYKSGRMQGLGRVYETQMNLFDGCFANGELVQGFIIDHNAKTISFGHHSSIDPQYRNGGQNRFIVKNTFQAASMDDIIEYRRNFHLKSLNFNSSYFNPPKLLYRSPWPSHILNKLNKKTHIESIIKSFHPTLRDVDISFIQKINQNSDNRLEEYFVEQIKQSNFANPRDRIKSEIREKEKGQFSYKVNNIEKKYKDEQPKVVMQKSTHIQDFINQNSINGQIQRLSPFKKARQPYVRQFKKIQRNRTYSKEMPQNILQAKNQQSTSKISNDYSQKKSNTSNTRHVQSSIRHLQSQIKHTQGSIKHTQPSLKHTQPSLKHTQPSLKHTQPSLKHTQPSLKHTQPSLKHQQVSTKHAQGINNRKKGLTNNRQQVPISHRQQISIGHRQQGLISHRQQRQKTNRQQRQKTNRQQRQKTNRQQGLITNRRQGLITNREYAKNNRQQGQIRLKTPSINSQFNKLQKEKDKNNLTTLINQYNQCQTQRKHSISGNTTKRNTDRKISPRQLPSNRQLGQQGFNLKGKEGKYSNNRRKVDLDLIS